MPIALMLSLEAILTAAALILAVSEAFACHHDEPAEQQIAEYGR